MNQLLFYTSDLRKVLRRVGPLALLALLLNTLSLSAQTQKITGTIKNESGTPLAGVSVTIKGATTGTSTDADGTFSLTASPTDTLEISYLGYESQTLPVGSKTIFDLKLQPKSSDLDQVVVVGFGTQKKVNLTGAVSSVGAKALADRPVRTAVQALQGQVTGLNISQNNGSLETNPTISIRGTGTIGTSSSSPLVLVDGMEGNINAINPQDIENVSILKDASASAIYGSRAAFGVILVTTKKGKSGKMQINYNNNFRSSQPVLLPKQMDSYTFALYFNDASTNSGSGAFFDEEHLQRIKDYQDGKITNSIIPDPNNASRWADGYGYGNDNVDWYRAIYKNSSFAHEHNISLNGGNEKTTYYLSGNLQRTGGMMRFNTDYYDRYGLTAKINNKISNILSVNYSMRYLFEGYQRPANLTTTLYQDLGRQGWPTLPLYDPNGYLFSSPSPALGLAEGGVDNNRRDWHYQQVQLVLEPIKGWKTFGEFNYRSRTDFRHWDVQQTYNHDVNGVPYVYGTNSEVYEYAYRENYFNVNIYSEYSKRIKDHSFKIMGGFQMEQTKYRDLSALRKGIVVPDIPVLNVTSGIDATGKTIAPTVTGQYQNWATAGFFGRLNYDYDGKYLLEANLRTDASSRFRVDKRWGLFPSVSVGWNVARETFFENLTDKISTLKFRASFGELGNQNTNDWYPTYLVMPTGTANGTWLLNGTQPNTASAPGLVSSTLTWETIRSYNVGLDFAVLNNKLSGSVDYFTRKTLDMVGLGPTLPVILGTAVPATNNMDLKTNGWELELTWADRLRNGLSYSFRAILSDYVSTVTRYPQNPTGLLNDYRAGQKMGEIWGYTTEGIAKTKEEMDAHLAKLSNGQSVIGSQWDAGDVMYADYNGDGKLDYGNSSAGNSGDQHVIGNSTPRYQFGFDANASWKGFDVRVFFQGVMKRDYWQGSYFFWGATDPIWWSTGFVQHADYFRNDPNHPLGVNTDSYYPRPLFSTKNQQTQTRYLQNAAYIRLKNLQIGYTLPSALTRKAGINNLRVYLSGENLWTGTKTAKMFDPETIDGGSGGSVYPLQKVLSAGLSITL